MNISVVVSQIIAKFG